LFANDTKYNTVIQRVNDTTIKLSIPLVPMAKCHLADCHIWPMSTMFQDAQNHLQCLQYACHHKTVP